MNFMDTWHELYAQHVDIVFWPSAYGGGMPIRAYAKLYHYAIVPAGNFCPVSLRATMKPRKGGHLGNPHMIQFHENLQAGATSQISTARSRLG
jgi:hypothetical protein